MRPGPRSTTSPTSPRGTDRSWASTIRTSRARAAADAATADEFVVVLVGHPQVGAGLGHPERLVPLHAPPLLQLLVARRRDGRALHDPDPVRAVQRVGVHLQQQRRHRGQAVEVRHIVFTHFGPEGGRVEGVQDDQVGTRHQCRDQVPLRVDVGERLRGEHRVLGTQVREALHESLPDLEPVPVRQHTALGSTGRTGRVLDVDGVLGGDRVFGWRGALLERQPGTR